MNKCNICGEEVDVLNGGAAIMIAFCHKSTTNLSNYAYCADCYEKLIKEKVRELNDAARLGFIMEGWQ